MSLLQHTGPSTLYTEFAELPLPVSADFVGDDVARVTYSVRDHERNTVQSLTKTFPGGITSDHHTTSHDSSEVKAFATSHSKSRQAILREISNGTSTKRFVEIWAGAQIEASLDVTKYHDAFHTDNFTFSLSFSPSETSLLYTAEANINSDDNASDDPYPKFRYTPHFAEPSRAKKRATTHHSTGQGLRPSPGLLSRTCCSSPFRWHSLPNDSVSQSTDDRSFKVEVTAISSPHTVRVLFQN
ncbi:hypothetical protein P692DRAFT_201863756 [Suillus brevipes Sb2]|nr:hypothetical protein P692DRAFT_201863756 [Suillus brevipes Sb2]